MSVRKFRASRVNNTTANVYVGQPGDMFYDPITGQLKISDGTTPGGHYINLVIATPTVAGAIKAGPGANVSSDGTLTIDTAGLPLSIGDLDIVAANISTVNANENLNLISNGTGEVNIVGNLHVHTTAQGPDYPTPILQADNSGNVITNGNLITNGNTYLVGTTTFVGPTVHTGNLVTNGNLITIGASYFIGNITEVGNITVTGNAVNNGYSVFNGNTTFNGNTIRNGSTISTGDVTWTGNTTTNGNAINNGPTVFNGNITITGNIIQTGNSTVNGATINNGLSVFNGNIAMTGNAVIAGNTNITGTATLTGNSYITGNTFVTGSATLTGNSYITGNTFVTGPTTVTGNVTITGNSVQTGKSIFIVSDPSSTIGSVEITGDPNGLYQTPINTGVMLQITGQDNLPNRIYADANANYNVITGRRFEGNMTNPTGVQGNIDLMRYSGVAYTTAGWANVGPARMSITTNEIQTGTNQGARIEFWTTANSAGPASSAITRTATIDPALGVWSNVGFVTVGNVIASNIIVGGLTIANNAIYSTLSASDINIGLLAATANIVMNRTTVFKKDTWLQGNLRLNGANGTGSGFNKTGGTVTANGQTGQVISNADSLAKSAAGTFTINNNYITSDKDIVIINIGAGGSVNSYAATVTRVNAAGFCNVTVTNSGTGALAEALTFNFAVIKVN
jgi:hypothetical protein